MLLDAMNAMDAMMHPITIIMLVTFFCTLFAFVCSIKCTTGGRRPSGGAFYAADKYKKCAAKVGKHIKIECIVLIATVEG